jgi:hypothetical protein
MDRISSPSLFSEFIIMLALSLLLAIGLATPSGEQGPARDGAQPSGADTVLIVPLRIHILTTPDLDLADCKLRDTDVTRIVGKLNKIWRDAGIYFGLESIVREPAAQIERFRLLVELNEGKMSAEDFALLLPKPSRAFDGLQAVFFRELPMNGAYLGDDLAIIQEGARLNEVKGGIDEPIPRVLGFTLATALGLEARQGPGTSLLAMGTTGVELDPREIERARRVAKTVKGVMTAAEAQRAAVAAQAAGQAERAKRLRAWLEETRGGPNSATGNGRGKVGGGVPKR